MLPLGNNELFVKGLRAVLLYLQTGDAGVLSSAAAHLDLACQKEATQKEAPGAEFARVKYLMYRAYVHERQGDPAFKKKLIESGTVSGGNYEFYFHAKMEKLSNVVMMQLQTEDALFMRHIRRALHRHAAANGKRYPASLAALVPKYMDHVPFDPACPKNSYAKRYALTEGAKSFDLTACDSLELGGRTSKRGQFNAEEEYKVYHMIVGDFLQRERLTSFLPPLVKYSGIKQGEVVADVGSGPGLFTFPFARIVGPKGKVFAVDINQSVLAYVRFIAERLPGLNVKVKHSVPDDVGLPKGTVDVAFMVQTYHAMLLFSDPGNAKVYKEKLLPWLTSIRAALKPGGRLVIQEGKEKISPEILQKQVQGAGFSTVRVVMGKPKPRDIIAVFKRP